MAESVSLTEVPLEEVTVPADDNEAVVLMYKKLQAREIPVFIMSAADVEFGESEDKHKGMIERAKAAIEAVTGEPYEAGERFDIIVSPGRGGDAGLHADEKPSDVPEEYHAHTAETGEAEGRFANPGLKLAESDVDERYDERLNQLWEEGKTDPDLIEPTVYAGHLKDGDTAVFRVTGRAPTYHDIRTIGTDRVSNATAIAPRQQKKEVPVDPTLNW